MYSVSIMAEANLIVTYDPAHSGKAEEEVKFLLDSQAEKPEFMKSDIDGLFLIRTKKNPKELTKSLNSKKNAKKFSYTYHWIPVDKWTTSKIEDMKKVMKELNGKIDPKESWKMELGKRHFEGKTTDLILKLTENIDKPKVDLKNPQKIIKVEIIGKKAGISLLDASEFLDVPKLKA